MFKNTKAFSGFAVNDLEIAKEFYGNTLGIEVEQNPEGLELKISGGTSVFIYSKPNHIPAEFTLLNFQVENVDETVDELIKKGIKMEHYDFADFKTDEKGILRSENRGPKAIAWFKDPSGNILSVLQEK